MSYFVWGYSAILKRMTIAGEVEAPDKDAALRIAQDRWGDIYKDLQIRTEPLMILRRPKD